jgi:hypothetical protein
MLLNLLTPIYLIAKKIVQTTSFARSALKKQSVLVLNYQSQPEMLTELFFFAQVGLFHLNIATKIPLISSIPQGQMKL